MTNLLDIHVGSVLVADDGFNCLNEGQKVVVEMDSDAFQPFGRQMHGLFVRCEKGRHYLAGQLDEPLFRSPQRDHAECWYLCQSENLRRARACNQCGVPAGHKQLERGELYRLLLLQPFSRHERHVPLRLCAHQYRISGGCQIPEFLTKCQIY